MFGIDSAELLIIALVALVVIGPKDLPRVMRTVGNFVGKARGMARHFRSGVDTMIRESELEEMEKQWQADNDRIMREHPLPAPDAAPADPAPAWAEPGGAPPPATPKRARAGRPKPPPRRPSAPPAAPAEGEGA